jgi:hypothetical protein
MPRTNVPNQTVSRDGITLGGAFEIEGSPSNGHVIDNPPGMILVAKNGDAADKYVEFVIGTTVDGQSVSAKRVTIPAGKTMTFGPFPKAIYGQASPDQDRIYVNVEDADIDLYAIVVPTIA